MDKRERCGFIECVNEVTYIVSERESSKAKLSYEDYMKRLVIKEAIQFRLEE